MSVLAFLRYLRPFRLRLSVAFVSMFLVGVLAAGTLLVMKPLLEVVIDPGEPAPEVPAEEEASLIDRLPPWLGARVANAQAALEARKERLDRWLQTGAARDPVRLLAILSAIAIALTFVKGVCEYLAKYNLAHALYHANLKMREDVFRSVLAQDYLYFTKNSAGYLISRINSDAQALRAFIDKIITGGVQYPITIASMFAVLLILSPRLTLVSVCVLPPMGFVVYYFGRVVRRNTLKQREKADELTSVTAESLHNVRLIKAMGTEDREIARFVRLREQLFKYYIRRRVAKFAHGPIMESFGMFAAAAVLMLGGSMILLTPEQWPGWGGALDPATFMVFLLTLTRFYKPFKGLSTIALKYQMARVSAERMLEMIQLEPRVIESADPRPFEGVKQGIELRGVSVRYGDEDILRDVSLTIPRGGTIALVGRSGSGKTTLANLIPRLFDPSAGAVLIDGVDLRDYRINDLRHRIGIVTQQTILFDDTVTSNIAYGSGRNGASREKGHDGAAPPPEIVEAARLAHADRFIRELDGGKGYRTRVGPGGTKLSGGQGQRIAIARALYRRPDILIFDEATSALDAESQALVQGAITEVLSGRTSIIISHRLSTVRGADRIYVLDKGRIVEEGTHEELMAAAGAYCALYQNESANEN